MKKLSIAIVAMGFFMLGTSQLFAQTKNDEKALLVKTNSESEVNKILQSLKGVDPSTYRFTVVSNKDGLTSTTIYGTAPLSLIQKVGGSGAPSIQSGYAASDQVLVVKVITNGRDIQRDIISKLDKSLTKQTVKAVKLNNLRVR